jgi:gliding motility-associated-like protein
MKNRHFYIVFILLFLLPGKAFSQINCITDPPLPPVFTSVSVEPETGYTKFEWNPSPSSNIAAYVLYSYKNGDGMPIDTVWDPSATSYTLTNNVTKYFSVSYVITAMRLPRCTSIFSNVLNSIFENVSIDTCMKKLVVSWNSYPSFPENVISYSVLSSVNGGIYSDTENVSGNDTSITLNDYIIDAEYCFLVQANLETGKMSTSNISCASTKMKRPPNWINADQATLNSDGKVALSFTVDPLSEINHFSLERKTGPTGVFQEISQPVSVDGKVIYIDNQANTNDINYYRLSAINSCNLAVTVSNIASNIVLALERVKDNIVLTWNPYKDWSGVVSVYKLFENTGNGFEGKAEISASDTSYTMGYQQIMYDVTGDKICFYITASERSNPYGITGESVSSQICTSPTEVITVPNVFTPNNDLSNDLFRPVLSFTPLDYHLIISDRKGNILFETRDFHAEWDGTQNGKPQPQGVCLWYLKLTTPSGKSISKTGTITLITDK